MSFTKGFLKTATRAPQVRALVAPAMKLPKSPTVMTPGGTLKGPAVAPQTAAPRFGRLSRNTGTTATHATQEFHPQLAGSRSQVSSAEVDI